MLRCLLIYTFSGFVFLANILHQFFSIASQEKYNAAEGNPAFTLHVFCFRILFSFRFILKGTWIRMDLMALNCQLRKITFHSFDAYCFRSALLHGQSSLESSDIQKMTNGPSLLKQKNAMEMLFRQLWGLSVQMNRIDFFWIFLNQKMQVLLQCPYFC